jgi:ATP-binding cassette subfamily B protein
MMNLNFSLDLDDEAAVREVVGEPIHYCIPADLTLDGLKSEAYFVIGDERWALVDGGRVTEYGEIADGREYKVFPLIGNAILEGEFGGVKRILARGSMKQASRYAYIAQIMNSLAVRRPIRIYNTEAEPICPTCGRELVHGTRLCPNCTSKMAVLSRLIAVSRNHWRKLLLGIVVLASMSGVSLLGPYFHKLLINSALKPPEGQLPDFHVFGLAIAGLVFALLFTESMNIVKGRIMAEVSSNISADLRKIVFDKIQSLSLGFITSQRAGDLMNRVTSDTDRIRNLIQEALTTAIFQIMVLISVSVLLFRADWQLALIVMIPAPLVAYLQVYVWRHVLSKMFHKQWRIQDDANSFLHDVLSGIRVVKSFGKETREITRFKDYNRKFAEAAFRSEKVYSILSPISNYLIQVGQYAVLLIGCLLIVRGSMNLGELIQFIGYAAMVYGPLTWLMFLPRWVANAVISIDRVFSVIDQEPEIDDADSSTEHRIEGDLSFRNVTFGYKSYEPVLSDINFEVKRGEMIGLVGHSGSGKSTLINLVSRFYDVNEGEIMIDGVDIRQIKQEDLRSQIGVVLQETFLFSGTILENIRYSKPEATLEEVIRAARVANAHDFIVKFADGYDTKVEENGNNLSGGERQRLAIARAVLGDPRILILDEATASLDIEAETAIQEALGRVTAGRTTIAIAHRLSTLRGADRLLVLEKGKIAEIGTHTELMKRQGIYYGLIMAQRNMAKPRAGQVDEARQATEFAG